MNPFRPDRSARKRCGTCRYYQSSPLRGQGWCRNPLLRGPHERALVSLDEFRCSKMLQDYWEPALAAEAAAPGHVASARSLTAANAARRRAGGANADLGDPAPSRSHPATGCRVPSGCGAGGGLGQTADPAEPATSRLIPSEPEVSGRPSDATFGPVRRRRVDPFAQTVPMSSLATSRPRRARPGRFAFVQRYCLYLMPIAAMLLLVGLGGLLLVPRPAPAKTPEQPATARDTIGLPVQPATASAATLPTAVPATPTPLPDKMRVVNAGSAGVWLRPEPNPTVNGMEKKPDGAVLDILGQEADVDGQPWRLVRDDRGNVGWVAAQYLGPAPAPAQPAAGQPLLARASVTARADRPSSDDNAAPVEAARVPATASVEFWLRGDPNQNARRVALILKSSSVVLVDSKAAEVLDRNLPSPAKWYLVRTPQGETGWAYNGWVRRD